MTIRCVGALCTSALCNLIIGATEMDSKSQVRWILDDEFCIRTEEGKVVAMLNRDTFPRGELESNAHLIAAAPDLLRELQHMRKTFFPALRYFSDMTGKPDLVQPFDRIDAVITKALNGADPSAEPNDYSPAAMETRRKTYKDFFESGIEHLD